MKEYTTKQRALLLSVFQAHGGQPLSIDGILAQLPPGSQISRSAVYPRIFAVTFDETFSSATGTRTKLYNMIIALLTAITVVLGMRMMGTLLISSLIVFPSLTAMRVCRQFKTTILVSAALSLVCFLTGITISYLYSVPTGACIVVVDILVFCLFAGVEKIRERT